MLWGHSYGCNCLVCCTLRRVFHICAESTPVPGFIDFAGRRLREVEADLRDFVGSQNTPRSFPGGAAPPEGIPGPLPGPPVAKAPVFVPPPPAPLSWRPDKPVPVLQLGVKAKLPEAPGRGPENTEVKEERSERSQDKGPVQDLEAKDIDKSPVIGENHKEKHKKKEKKHRHKEERAQSSKARKVSSSPSPTRKEARKERSKSSGRKRAYRSPEKGVESSPKGKEKKRRHEEPEGEAVRSSVVPRTPSHSPPTRRRQEEPDSRVKGKGKGWKGDIPRSNHPRWTHGTNKGVTKRAKQELYHRRRKR